MKVYVVTEYYLTDEEKAAELPMVSHSWAVESFELKYCPVLFDDGECGEALKVFHSHTIVGDDYGSWAEDNIYFLCGHTFGEMINSLRHRDQI